MADVRVSSIFMRLRHPVHEAGQTNQFDAQTQEWVIDEDGRPTPLQEKGPFTPQQLAAKGLTLPVILDQALQTAVSDRVAALAQATGATAERDQARQERTQAIAERDAALARVAELEAQLAQSTGQTVEAIEQRNRISQQLSVVSSIAKAETQEKEKALAAAQALAAERDQALQRAEAAEAAAKTDTEKSES